MRIPSCPLIRFVALRSTARLPTISPEGATRLRNRLRKLRRVRSYGAAAFARAKTDIAQGEALGGAIILNLFVSDLSDAAGLRFSRYSTFKTLPLLVHLKGLAIELSIELSTAPRERDEPRDE